MKDNQSATFQIISRRSLNGFFSSAFNPSFNVIFADKKKSFVAYNDLI